MAKDGFKRLLQRRVDSMHAHAAAEISQTRHAQVRHSDPTRNDPRKMRQIGINVQRNAVKADPAADPNADRGNFVFGNDSPRTLRFVGSPHPNAHPLVTPLAAHVEPMQGGDEPLFQGSNEGVQIRSPPSQIQHDIGDALTRSMIGELAAAAALVNRQ
jgi:hypothetical protein